MKKNSLIIILSIFLIGSLIILGLFLFSNDNKATPSSISPDIANFENSFYDYLAISLQEIFISSGDKNSGDLTQKIEVLTEEGISMINEFIDQQKQKGQFISQKDYDRLNQLRFYVYSSIAIDEEKSRESLNLLPNNPIKLALLYTYIETFTKEDSKKISTAVFESYLSNQEPWAKVLDEKYLEMVATIKFKADPIGKPLPNHLANYQSIKGKSLDLNLFHGKHVLLDFWATWCLPCIAELPYLQEAYQNYQSKGFEIISISLDENEESFRNFISDRNIAWIQYYDGKGFRGDLVSAYGVTSIPVLYLVDPQGKVLSVNMRGEELLQILESYLGS